VVGSLAESVAESLVGSAAVGPAVVAEVSPADMVAEAPVLLSLALSLAFFSPLQAERARRARRV